MEDDLQAITVGIAQDVLIELHRLLLVASEEVNLDAYDTDTLHPAHLFLAGNTRTHTLTRSLWGIVFITVGTVPQHQVYTLRLRIFRQLRYLVATDTLVPPVIYQTVLKTHRCRQVDELHLIGIIDTLVLPDEPTPCVAPGLILLRRLIERFQDIVRDSGLDNGLQGLTNGDGAPRSRARHRDTSRCRSITIVLTLLRIGDGIACLFCIVTQMTACIR